MAYECRISVFGDLEIGESELTVNEVLGDRAMGRPGRAESATVLTTEMLPGIQMRWDGRPAELWSAEFDFGRLEQVPDRRCGCALCRQEVAPSTAHD